MEYLVTYDVSTETPEGVKRLRKVAKVCEAYCQRVQKSVFECTLNAAQLEQLRYRLEREVNVAEDSLRFYRLTKPRERFVQVIGRQPVHDLREPLVL